MSGDSKVVEIQKAAKKPRPTAKKTGGGGGGVGGGKSSGNPNKFGKYCIKNGCLYLVKLDRDGNEIEVLLTNITAKIVEYVVLKNGLEESTEWHIQGWRSNGSELPLAKVADAVFSGGNANWLNPKWGPNVIVEPGATTIRHVRAAIQYYSALDGDVPVRTVYQCSGWEKIDRGEWAFLHTGGAITAQGLVETVEVELPGNLAKYQLPAPLAGGALKAALASALQLPGVCPSKPQVGAALLCMALRSPLNECLDTDFVLFLHGLTGSRKSSVAKLALGFHGLGFTSRGERNRGFPGNWLSSPKAVPMQCFLAKDTVFIADDLKYTGGRSDDDLVKTANDLIMAIGNGSGRDTLTADRRLRNGQRSRCSLICTGEDTPKSQSTFARMLTMEITRQDVDEQALTALQIASESGQFAGLMSAYLQWMASNLDRLKSEFPALVVQLADSGTARQLASSHPRAPGIYANMVAAVEIFAEFLQDTGLMGLVEINAMQGGIEQALQSAFEGQRNYQDDQDPCLRFIELIQSALAAGDAHLPDKNTQEAPKVRPHACGWGRSGPGSEDYTPNGKRIGWFDPPKVPHSAKVYLLPDAAFEVAQGIAGRQRQPFFGGNAKSLWRLMMHRGLIVASGDKKSSRATWRKQIGGVEHTVLVMEAGLLLPAGHDSEI